jgi:predicted nucleic acid-binding protein
VSKPPSIYVDSSVIIDFVSDEAQLNPKTGEPRWKDAKALLDAVDDGRVILATSAMVDAELGAHALIRDGDQSVQDMVRGWLDHPDTKYLEIDRFLARDANRLCRTWHRYAAKNGKLSGADALHLAAAIRLDSDYLITQDGDFPLGQTVEGVEVTRPHVVWEPTLLDGLG